MGNLVFLIEKGNSKEWVKKISILLGDTKKSQKMGIMGQEYVKENFSLEKTAQRFVSIFNEVIK